MYSDDEEAEVAVEIQCLWSSKIPATCYGQREQAKPSGGPSGRVKEPAIVATHYDSFRRRLYYGLEDGSVCFLLLTKSSPNTNAHRFVGSHKGAISAIATPRPTDGDLGKGGLIVTGSVDSSIKIWDYQGKVILDPTVCVQTLYGHTGTVTSLVILGDYIVSSSTDGCIKMWRQEEGRRQLVYPWFELQATVSGMQGWVRCMSYDNSGDVGDLGALYAADESGGFTKIVPEGLWDDSIQRLSTRMDFRVGKRVEDLHDRSITIVRYVAKWDLVLTVAYDQCIRGYDIKTDSVRFCWPNEQQCQFTSLEINMEFDEILAGDANGVLSIFSIRTGRLMVTKQISRQQQQSAAAAAARRGSASAKSTASAAAAAAAASAGGGSGGPAGIQHVAAVLGRQLYAVVTAREVGLWRIEHELDYNVARGGHEKAVISLYTCSGGVAGPGSDLDYRVFSASLDNTVRLWDPYDMACIRVMEESRSEISAMTFYEGWNLLVTGHDNGDIRLWNLDTGNAVTLRQHSNTVTALVLALVHRNEELLISASYDGWVVLWDIRSLRGEEPHMVAKFRAHGPEALGGRGIPVTGGGALLPLDSGNFSPRQPSTYGGGTSSSSGAGAGGAGGDGQESRGAEALRKVLATPEPEILALKYDPLKKAVVTGGTDRTIKVWAAAGYDYLGCHRGHKDAVTCLALDANFLFSGSDDCTICMWDTVPAAATKQPGLAGRLGGTSGGATGGGASAAAAAAAGAAPPPVTLKAPFNTRPLKVLSGHRRAVTGLDVLPASGNLVSCSLDGSLRIWDYVTGQVLHKFEHEVEEFRCLALRYDRPEVLVGTKQASLLRYPIHEAAVAAPGMARGPGRPGPQGAGQQQSPSSGASVKEGVQGLTISEKNGAGGRG